MAACRMPCFLFFFVQHGHDERVHSHQHDCGKHCRSPATFGSGQRDGTNNRHVLRRNCAHRRRKCVRVERGRRPRVPVRLPSFLGVFPRALCSDVHFGKLAAHQRE